jgi:hypothetical protein
MAEIMATISADGRVEPAGDRSARIESADPMTPRDAAYFVTTRQSSGKGFARSRRWMGTHSQPWRYNSLTCRITLRVRPVRTRAILRGRKGAIDAESGRPVCVVAFSGCGLNNIHHVFGTFAEVSYFYGESPPGRKMADFSP